MIRRKILVKNQRKHHLLLGHLCSEMITQSKQDQHLEQTLGLLPSVEAMIRIQMLLVGH